MRRLPIYFLIDVSESMVGEPIEQVQKGMRQIIQELRLDPYALETAFVSVIAFAGKAQTLVSLTELFKFYPPDFLIGSGTSLGNAMNHLMVELDRSLQKNTMEVKGDWKPIIFLFTDGTPTDDYNAAFEKWNIKYRSHCNLVAISIGDNVDTQMLGKLTDNVMRLKETNEASFKQFFKWITASIKTTTLSVTEVGNDGLQLATTDGINLEKVDSKKYCKVDENYVVLMGKCQSTNKPYLVKYAKRFRPSEFVSGEVQFFKLVGAYSIDGEKYTALSDASSVNRKINTQELLGQPTCPCCGNQVGAVVCECGNIFCVGENVHNKCPWCGMEGELGFAGEGGIDVTRTRG